MILKMQDSFLVKSCIVLSVLFDIMITNQFDSLQTFLILNLIRNERRNNGANSAIDLRTSISGTLSATYPLSGIMVFD